MDLTVGPNAFFWPAETVRAFYAALTDVPVARVVIGEWVCSKRLPFWQDEIPIAVDTLMSAGKEVALSSLALITLRRERKLAADLARVGLPVEINDLSALIHLEEGTPFWVGPMVNVYNEGTLRWLAARGAARVCLPPELPLTSVQVLAETAQALGVALEVWGHGRAPLAISGRCYHARLHGRAKDSCQFVCGDDPDGREVETMEGQPFLRVNGVQTLGHHTQTALPQLADLRAAGVSSLRLSPQIHDFPRICAHYDRALAGGSTAPPDLAGVDWANGFLAGRPGVEMVGP